MACAKTALPCAGVLPSVTSRRDTGRWDSVNRRRRTARPSHPSAVVAFTPAVSARMEPPCAGEVMSLARPRRLMMSGSPSSAAVATTRVPCARTDRPSAGAQNRTRQTSRGGRGRPKHRLRRCQAPGAGPVVWSRTAHPSAGEHGRTSSMKAPSRPAIDLSRLPSTPRAAAASGPTARRCAGASAISIQRRNGSASPRSAAPTTTSARSVRTTAASCAGVTTNTVSRRPPTASASLSPSPA